MRQRDFKWAFQLPMGEGWIPVGAGEGWFPGEGFLVSHDVVEHLSNKTDWAHELRATGVSVYDVAGIRKRNNGSIAEDIVNFAHADHEFNVPEAPARLFKPLRSAMHEGKIQAFVDEMRDIISGGLDAAKKEGLSADILERARTFPERAAPWIRLGYRAAQRIYGRNRGVDVGLMMDKLRDAINEDHDASKPTFGDRLSIRVNTQNLTFAIERTKVEVTDDEKGHAQTIKGLKDMHGLVALAKALGVPDGKLVELARNALAKSRAMMKEPA